MDKFEFDIKRYAADTAHLCVLDHGAYLKLLIHYYSTEMPLLDDDAALAQIAGVTPEVWDGMKVRIRKFFQVGEDGRLHQKRCDRTISMAQLDQEQGEQANGKQRRTKKRQGDRIPADWRPTAALEAYARVRDLDPDRTAEEFRDYFLASDLPSAWKLSWDAAFRTWCRDPRRRRPGGNGGPPGSSPNGSGGGFTGTLLRLGGAARQKLD